ncbi:DUF6361 family protein [Microbulbifer litoralis]|uniref:DUF6361 family protein n=1 Tax=Microbulbifer litoralis TaxID=2933965 RepID=UPI0020296447
MSRAAATLSWVDLTCDDRDKVRQVLDLFNEQGTVDELGLGSLRDMLSDALFPGTSSLHTRLRYFLFIPWIYREIESWGPGYDVAETAREDELSLIDALDESGDRDGLIGIQARHTLARLPSTVYWAGLVRWGIFMPQRSQAWYHKNIDRLAGNHPALNPVDDPGIMDEREWTWHPRLPKAPDGMPEEGSFQLTSEEAEFLRGRIAERCGDTLLDWLAHEGSVEPATELWEDPDALRAGPEISKVFQLARRFSLHVEGAPLLYNLMLAEKRHQLEGNERDLELIESYRTELQEWAARELAEAPFEPANLWSFAASRTARQVPAQQRNFVETWSHQVTAIGADQVAGDLYLRRLITTREQDLKSPRRARLINSGRLLDWRGRVGVGRMNFRWPKVRQLLIDLHRGLQG